MTQQTAIEWLDKEIDKVWKGDIMYMELPRSIYYRLLNQAKAMEKEQMYQVWLASEQWSDGEFLDSKKSFEEYYNETFKQQ